MARRGTKIEIDAPELPGVYMIQNVQTGKRYIGSAANVKKRLSDHANSLRLGYRINRKVDADIEAGFDQFSFSVLATFADGTITNRELGLCESKWVRLLGTMNEYNYPWASTRSRLNPDSLCWAHGSVSKEEQMSATKQRS